MPGTVYVDDWVKLMLAKPRLNTVRRPIKDSELSIKFIRHVPMWGAGARNASSP